MTTYLTLLPFSTHDIVGLVVSEAANQELNTPADLSQDCANRLVHMNLIVEKEPAKKKAGGVTNG